MRAARSVLIISYGLFTIAAQALLFRQYITTFESTDISVGIFFGCWFAWIGLGALGVGRVRGLAEKLSRVVDVLFLLYIPAFLLEMVLIVWARRIAGMQAYQLLSIRQMLVLSLLVNAPVSLLTGALFPLACRWFERSTGAAVWRVYVLEAAGSFAGGIGVTILLGYEVSPARVFFIISLVLSLSVAAVRIAAAAGSARPRLAAMAAVLVPGALFVGLGAGLDESLGHKLQAIRWRELLGRSGLEGSFQTAQAQYLYGHYGKQWVVIREGSVVESLPERAGAGRTAAIVLSQKPDARRVLVAGSGLALCERLLVLPQIEEVTWTGCDSEYIRRINGFVPDQYRVRDRRLKFFSGEIRELLAQKKDYYDIVVIDVGAATSSVLNRFYTRQFYHQVRHSLSREGVVAVQVAGGENVLGTELVNLGASVRCTLLEVFQRLVLVPGEHTWFIAGDGEALTDEPGTLRDRFAGIENGQSLLSPEALFSIYLPDRAAKAMDAYEKTDLPRQLLVNTDSRPLAHLYSLLLLSRQAGSPVARFVKRLCVAGVWVFVVPVLVVVVVRLLYRLRSRSAGGEAVPSSFESSFLVLTAGFGGMAIALILMYLYQMRYGSLYLHIGLVSSGFMLGLTAGGLLAGMFAKPGRRIGCDLLLVVVLAVHLVLLWIIAFGAVQVWGHVHFGLAFVAAGCVLGGYFPLAARQLAEAGFGATAAGARLEAADHFGATVGALVVSLGMLPVLGARVSLLVLAAVAIANAPLAALRRYKPAVAFTVGLQGRLRATGYCLLAAAIAVIICSDLVASAAGRLRVVLPVETAQALAGQNRIVAASGSVGGRKVRYFEVYADGNEPSGYIFSTRELAPEVRGFGGALNIAVHVDRDGRLVDFHIVRSNETPAYLAMLEGWQQKLTDGGYNLFGAGPFAGVDAVSGATISSRAVLDSLTVSARRFASEILALPVAGEGQAMTLQKPERAAIYLAGVAVVALVAIYAGGAWLRVVVLALVAVGGGLILNVQYSTEQVVGLLSGRIPAVGLSSAFLLAVGVPGLVLVFGNMYCGWMCPFGAVQELLSYLVPKDLKPVPDRDSMGVGRFMKYVVLFVLVVVFFLSRDKRALAADPLVSVFNFSLQRAVAVSIIVSLVAGIFYGRFWCRYLCPAGAFLSLLNAAAPLRRLLPAKKFGRCEFGVTKNDRLDCIYCDRCRFERAPILPLRQRRDVSHRRAVIAGRCFVAGVVGLAVILSAVSAKRLAEVSGAAGFSKPGVVASAGQPRDVDITRVRRLIRQGRLSEKEAQYYRKVD